MHVNSIADLGVKQFVDIGNSLGLVQHVDFSTCRLGNILELLFTECASEVRISSS